VWHPSVYWGISTEDDGYGLRSLEEWLSECDPDMPTFLPVSDPEVQVSAGFVDPDVESGLRVHSAIDYSRPDGESFQVHAIADGHVIFVGYHPSTGHVVITEHHPVEGQPFRAIYHHLRNGRDADIERALATSEFIENNEDWSWDIYAHRYVDRAERARQMLREGNVDRAWMERTWGSNEQVISVREGDNVYFGQVIAWAGSTGIHTQGNQLHFAVARQANFVESDWAPGDARTGDLRWTLFDPYGLYTGPAHLDAYNHDDGVRHSLQHPSLFAPLPVDVLNADIQRFREALSYYEDFKYFPINLSVQRSADNNQWLVSANFRYRPEGHTPLLALEHTEFERALVQLKYEGYRASQIIPSTTAEGQVVYSAVIREIDDRSYLSEARLDPESFQTHLNRLYQRGFILNDFTPYYDGSKQWVAATWSQPVFSHDYHVHWHVQPSEFDLLNATMAEEGFTLNQLRQYAIPGKGERFAAIWGKDDDFAHGPRAVEQSLHYTLLDKHFFTQNLQEMERAGFELRSIDAHEDVVNLVYKRFVAEPSESAVPLDLPADHSLGDLLIANRQSSRVSALPVFGEVLADSSIAPKTHGHAVAKEVGTVRFVDPATGGEIPLPTASKAPVSIELEGIASSIQVTEGRVMSQYVRDAQGEFQQEMQALWTEASRGAIMRIPVAVPRTGTYALRLSLNQAPNAGVIQVYHEGQRIGQAVNGYNAEVHRLQTVDLETVELNRGVNYLDVRIRGKDHRSEGYAVGIDKVELIPVNR
jgi:hypothetical protein